MTLPIMRSSVRAEALPLENGKAGWSLSPAYDLNPVPTDLKARILTTNIDLDEGTCSLDPLDSASQFFGLTLAGARHHQRSCDGDRNLGRYRQGCGRPINRDSPHGERF